MKFQLIAFASNCSPYANAVREKGHEAECHPVSDHWQGDMTYVMEDIKSKISSKPNATWLIAEPAFAHMIEDSLDFPFNRQRMYLNLLPRKGYAFYDKEGSVYNLFERKSFRNRVRTHRVERDLDETRIYCKREDAIKHQAIPLLPDDFMDTTAYLLGRLLNEKS